MTIYRATSLHFGAIEQGAMLVSFEWSDPLYGVEGLDVDVDGFCSRKMPIRSGKGPLEIIHFRRDSIALKFPPVLAEQLELDEEIEISFTITDDEFNSLGIVVDFIRLGSART